MSRQREQQLLTEIAERSNRVKAIWDAAGDEQLDSKTKQDVLTLNKEIEEREYEVKEIREQRELRAANEQRQRDLHQPAAFLPTPQAKADAPAAPQTVGEQVLADPDFKAWRERIAGKGVTRAQFGNSPAVGLKTLVTGVSSTSAGAFVTTDRLGIVDAGVFRRPLTVLDLLTTGTTDSDTVEYVREGTHTNNAAPVAEATATGDGSGVKPESAMALAIVTETVKTIAHWIPATRRALADAGQMRTLIDNFLRYGLEEELEDQVLNGTGAGENFTGIYNTTGTSTQAYSTSLLETTRKARTLVMTQGRATPTAYLMHPTDWEAFDLLKDAENRYYFGGPSVLGTPRLWGLPVVESEANTAGHALVADWRLAVLWNRQAAQILVSDSHSDFFVRNLIAILAEMRAAFGVIRPAAFVEIDLTA